MIALIVAVLFIVILLGIAAWALYRMAGDN